MADKPGILLYYSDVRPLEDELNDTELGAVMRAAFRYSEDGTDPVFDDRTLRFAFQTLKKALVRDDKKYESKRKSTEYARYCRNEKTENRKPKPFSEWLESIENTAFSESVLNQTESTLNQTESDCINTNNNNNYSYSNNYNYNNNYSNSYSISRARGEHGDTPKREEIEKYCSDHGFTFSVDSFIEYYTDRNWNIQDWKAAARGWQKRQREPRQTKAEKRNSQYQKHGKLSDAGRKAVQELLKQEDA